ncbi:MAG: PIN domain-containing protein [Crenarchaeota archaeon]|nr:PIN domain-containing protein [Thermoproteota archaeon]
MLAIIKKEDHLKSAAESILENIVESKITGVYASTASMQEIVFWFHNRQLFTELISAINILSHLRNLEWVPLTPDVCITASLLLNEYKLSPFDAYHAATAISRDKIIISTEHIYDKIKGVTRINPADLASSV